LHELFDGMPYTRLQIISDALSFSYQFFYFIGDNTESSTCVTGLGSLYFGIECQQA